MTQQSKPERRMSGKAFLVILLLGAIVGVALVGASIYLNAAPSGTASLTGTLFIGSGGSLDPGPPGVHTASSYDVTLTAVSGSGTMSLTALGNATDVLQRHEFQVSDFVLSPNNLTMVFSGASVNLGWINNSTVWKSFNDTYIGAWGPSAPASELRGSISPADFPGVPSDSYLILSLSIVSQPESHIPFLINPMAVWSCTTSPNASAGLPKD